MKNVTYALLIAACYVAGSYEVIADDWQDPYGLRDTADELEREREERREDWKDWQEDRAEQYECANRGGLHDDVVGCTR